MQLMDSKRPSGSVAMVLPELLSMASGWMALAGAPDSESKPVEASPIDESPIAFTWQDAEVLIELGILQVDEYSADGGAVATLAASGSGPTVVVILDDARGVVPPCKNGWVPGPGGGCINGGWQVFDYPPKWKLKSCEILLAATKTAGAYVRCEYEYSFEFLRQVASTRCGGCPYGEVCVEYAQYTFSCKRERWVSGASCDCPAAPDAGGWANGSATCTPPALSPADTRVVPGGALPGWVVTKDVKCYKPGSPW